MTRRSPTIAMLCAGLALASCSSSKSSAVADEPLPTIGLGSDLADGAGGLAATIPDATGIDTVVMIGDSITVASRPALEASFARLGFEKIVIVAQNNKRTALSFGDNPSGASVAASILAAGGDPGRVSAGDAPVLDDDHSDELWIVALGTNDVAQYGDAAERAAAFNEMLAAVPAEAPMIWVDTYFRDRPDGAADINDVIQARVARRPNSTVARWSLVADLDGNLRDDGVHPRETGSVAFAAVISATIVDFLQSS